MADINQERADLLSMSKAEVIKKFQVKENDTGCPEVQIALLQQRIKNVSKHLVDGAKHDFTSQLGMKKMIGAMNRLLRYLKRQDCERFTKLRSALGLTKNA